MQAVLPPLGPHAIVGKDGGLWVVPGQLTAPSLLILILKFKRLVLDWTIFFVDLFVGGD